MATYDPKKLYVFLSELGILSKEVLDQAYIEAVQEKKTFDDVLLEREMVVDENIGKAVAEVLHVPFVTLSKLAIPDDVLRLIPEVIARKEYVIAYGKDTYNLQIALYNPENTALIRAWSIIKISSFQRHKVW